MWSAERIETLSVITADDMEDALAAWQDVASGGLAELALAGEEDQASDQVVVGGLVLALSTLYFWDAKRGVYVNAATGKTVSFAVVRDLTESVAQRQLSIMEALSTQYMEGAISLAEWQSGMARQIKILHVNASVLARGGWSQMNQSDWGYVGSLVKAQYQFLDNFADQVANGTQLLDGTFLFRVGMYEDAARSSFEEMRRRVERVYNNMDEEMRELGVADHCDDCLAAAGQGWQPIGTLPRIGESRCRTNCHCRFRYRRRTENGWVVSGS